MNKPFQQNLHLIDICLTFFRSDSDSFTPHQKLFIMKKQTLLISATLMALILSFFAFNGWSSSTNNIISTTQLDPDLAMDQNMLSKELKEFPEFIYDIGPRFGGIKKSEIAKMTSAEALLEQELIPNIGKIKSSSIIIFEDEQQSDIRAEGQTLTFNEAQLKLLRSSDHSTSFVVRLDFDERDPSTGRFFDSYRSPHHTIIPEQQATYSDGMKALKLFLRESCQSELTGVDSKNFKAAKLYFTVNKDGTITNVKLDHGSGYPKIDQKMKESIKATPGNWTPAKNENGETVVQELVVSFGLMGC